MGKNAKEKIKGFERSRKTSGSLGYLSSKPCSTFGPVYLLQQCTSRVLWAHVIFE